MCVVGVFGWVHSLLDLTRETLGSLSRHHAETERGLRYLGTRYSETKKVLKQCEC